MEPESALTDQTMEDSTSPPSKEAIRSCGKQIIFYEVGSHQQNGIVERMIKELSVGIQTLLLHATRLFTEAVSTMLCHLSFESSGHRYNSLEIDEEVNTPEHKYSNVEFRILPIDYHTWVYPVFFLEFPLQGGPARLPKWEPRSSTGVYLGHSPFHYGSVSMVLNTITGCVSPQYHVVFDGTFSTVEHMRKGTVPGNWKNLV